MLSRWKILIYFGNMLKRNTTNYVISGTKFLRLASKSILDIYGTNLQNIEKSARKLYKPDYGKILCQRDQSGAEALIVAYLCRAGSFRSLFLNRIKPHVFVAIHLFPKVWQTKLNETTGDIKFDIDELINTPIPLLTSNPWWKKLDTIIKSSDNWPPAERYYYISKQVCHSSNYGITSGPFCLNTLEKSRGKIVLKEDDAKFFLSMYHTLFPEIHEWHREVEEQVRTTRILYNLLGSPIQFTAAVESSKEIKEAFSAVPQSTVAEITRSAVTQYQNFIEDTGVDFDILQDNHDSFLTQCPIEQSDENQKIMKQFIEPELTNFKGEKFNMKSEGASGYNWSSYDEKKNPNGLREAAI